MKVYVFALMLLLSISLASAASTSYHSAFDETTFDTSSRQFSSKIYTNPVNLMTTQGIYRPYTEVTSFTATDNELVLQWNNKKVTLKYYTADTSNVKSYFVDKSGSEKQDLGLTTSITSGAGYYEYHHTMRSNSTYFPEKFGYDILTENVTCTVDGLMLICDEQQLDFSDASMLQGITVSVESGEIEFSGGDLSYIDPRVNIYFDDDLGGTIRKRCDDNNYEYLADAFLNIGSNELDLDEYIARGYVKYHVGHIPNSATITRILWRFIPSDVQVTDCSGGGVELNFYELDEENFTNPPDTDPEMEDIYDAIGADDLFEHYFHIVPGNVDTLHVSEFFSNGTQELQTLIDSSPTPWFMVGFKQANNENCGSVCNVDISTENSVTPYLVVDYVLEEPQACDAEVHVVASAPNLNVTINGSFVGNTSEVYYLETSITNGVCGSQRTLNIYCANSANLCYSETFALGTDAETITVVESNCAQMCSIEPNLWFTNKDVSVRGNIINFTFYSSDVNRTVPINISVIDQETGLMGDSILVQKFIASDSTASVQVNTLDLTEASAINIYLDPDRTIAEPKDDNYVYRLVTQNTPNVYLSVNTSYPELDSLLRSYLEQFVNSVDLEDADVIISVGRNTPEFAYSNFRRDEFAFPLPPSTFVLWGHDGDSVVTPGRSANAEYAGLVGRTTINGTPIVLVYGNEEIGHVVAVKRLVSARSYFLSQFTQTVFGTASVLPLVREPVLIDDYDVSAVGTYSILGPKLRTGQGGGNSLPPQFLLEVNNVLFDNIYDIAIRTVKTLNTTSYNQSTVLRLKNVNADYDDDFRDAISNSSVPVVFSGGIFSNLEKWEEEGDGLAIQLANAGRDTWEIEMNGGPTTECSTCPNYFYQDLVDYHWPSLIAGVLAYTNKTKVDYVGHSNGARVALSALNEYSISGKAEAGYYFNYSSGQYVDSTLPNLPVRKLVTLGAPIDLLGPSYTRYYSRLEYFTPGIPNGDLSILRMFTLNLTHIDRSDYSYFLGTLAFPGIEDDYKISRNLMIHYNDLYQDRGALMELHNISVERVYIYGGTQQLPLFPIISLNDGAVPIVDVTNLHEELEHLDPALRINFVDHGQLVTLQSINNLVKEDLE